MSNRKSFEFPVEPPEETPLNYTAGYGLGDWVDPNHSYKFVSEYPNEFSMTDWRKLTEVMRLIRKHRQDLGDELDRVERHFPNVLSSSDEKLEHLQSVSEIFGSLKTVNILEKYVELVLNEQKSPLKDSAEQLTLFENDIDEEVVE